MKDKKGVQLKCPFNGGFAMPKLCFSCGSPASDKKWQITTTNRLKNQKFIVNFPICDACVEAQHKFIHIGMVNIIAVVVIALSIFSMLNPSASIPRALFYTGGSVWIAGVIAYVYWLNRKAKIQNSAEVVERHEQLRNAVAFKKITLPRKATPGEVTVLFSNRRFAKEFLKLNKGQEIKQ